MRLNAIVRGLLCIGMTLQPALAAPPLSVDVVPTMKMTWLFGAADQRTAPLLLTTQFNYRWAGMQRQMADDAAVASDFFSKHYRTVDIAQFASGRNGWMTTHILGRDFLDRGHRLNQTEEAGAEPAGTPWYWYALGAVAVAGGVAIAASGSSEGNDNSSSGPGPRSGCNFVGGNNVSGGEVYVTQGCQDMGLPDIP